MANKKPKPCHHDEDVIILAIYWSREARNKLALHKSTNDPNQLMITSFYDLVDSVHAIWSKNPDMLYKRLQLLGQ